LKKSKFSNGSHLECRMRLLDTILKGEGTIPVNIGGYIWFSFRGKDLNLKDYDVLRTDDRY